jgi:hypothetical protein
MKKSELRQIIREEISKVLNEDEEIDLSKPFSVVGKGGTIGSSTKNYFPQFGGSIIKTFDTAEEAKEYAARRRKQLTPGEKSYYKMTYTVVRTPKKR